MTSNADALRDHDEDEGAAPAGGADAPSEAASDAVVAPDTPLFTIAAVERDTRIGKDTLRVWERRYGFPVPARNRHGERLYSPAQVERLREVKRLLDVGHRPGRIVALSLAELQQLALAAAPAQRATPRARTAGIGAGDEDLIDLVRRHDARELRVALAQRLLVQGLVDFVTNVAVPLLQAVGEAWARGELAVFEEHLCSEALESVLRSAVNELPPARPEASPRVLLATVSFEAHGLSLLMAEALLGAAGCACLSLGRQVPVGELVQAARAHRADVVALSFSSASTAPRAIGALVDLRSSLPPRTDLWAGCSLAAVARRCPPGVKVLPRLGDIDQAVADWRLRQSGLSFA